MKLLYLGPEVTTSALRIAAFRRLGHEVDVVDPTSFLPNLPRIGSWVWHTGALGLSPLVERGVRKVLSGRRYDLIFVDQGALVNGSLVRYLKRSSDHVINYNLDNPFSDRDGQRWRIFGSALAEYDLFVTPRPSSVEAAYAAGAKRAIRLFQCADEVRERPRVLTQIQREKFTSKVCFVGTWMQGRGAVLQSLIKLGVPLTIYGSGWAKAPEYQSISACIREGHLAGEDYSSALLGADVVLCMLSQGNMDLHTTRSIEAPALGAAMCAPRTADHLELYEDGAEVLLWSSVEECAAQCLSLVADPQRARAIGAAALARAQANGHYNEKLLPKILQALSATG